MMTDNFIVLKCKTVNSYLPFFFQTVMSVSVHFFTHKSYFFLKHGQPYIIKVSELVKIVLPGIDFIKAAVTCAEMFVHDTN